MRTNVRVTLALGALTVVVACSRDVRAQALPTASGPGTYVSAGAGYSDFQADYGQRRLGGGMVFVDVHPTWRYGLEAEARLLNANIDEGVKESTYLVGPHVYLLSGRLRPYAKLLVGAGKIDFPFGYGQGTYFTYAPGLGVDYVLDDRFGVRADYEYQQWTKFTYGTLNPNGISVGIVIRINGVPRFPKK